MKTVRLFSIVMAVVMLAVAAFPFAASASSTVNTANLVLNAVKAENLGMPFKNIDHTVFDMSFMAFADATDTVYKWSFTV